MFSPKKMYCSYAQISQTTEVLAELNPQTSKVSLHQLRGCHSS